MQELEVVAQRMLLLQDKLNERERLLAERAQPQPEVVPIPASEFVPIPVSMPGAIRSLQNSAAEAQRRLAQTVFVCAGACAPSCINASVCACLRLRLSVPTLSVAQECRNVIGFDFCQVDPNFRPGDMLLPIPQNGLLPHHSVISPMLVP